MKPIHPFPKTLKQFGMGRLFTALTVVAIAFAIRPMGGWLPVIAVGSYLIAQLLFHAADRIDDGALDSRKFMSKLVNAAGLIAAVIAYVATICAVGLIGLAMYGIILER